MVFPMVPAGGSNDQIIMNKEDLKKLWVKEYYLF
jgi:hypothetical protein